MSRSKSGIPYGAGGGGKGAHQVSDVIWNVDGQRGYLRLDRFHWGLGRILSLLLFSGQNCESDLDVCAGESENAPLR